MVGALYTHLRLSVRYCQAPTVTFRSSRRALVFSFNEVTFRFGAVDRKVPSDMSGR